MLLRWAGALFLVAAPFYAAGAEVVNDVTQLNPVTVAEVVAPRTLEELVAAVVNHPGKLSIGGGRYSMGGQTAIRDGVQIDMRQFNQVLAFSPEDREITVQAGITWRQIQEHIDAANLSLQIMQTYANFTVGGTLSVNAHGRYIGLGPVVMSVKSIRLVLANGNVVLASPGERSDLFYGAIGGYGALGVIAEVTLVLADNAKVKRETVVMPLTSYWKYFARNVRDNPDVIFHNADIYPNAFDTVRVSSYVRTDRPVTVPDRLIPRDLDYSTNRRVYNMVTEWPAGRWLRQRVVDPLVYRGEQVEWRNYEASYDVRDLEPESRKETTFVLQEYFVPVQKLDAFVPVMGEILNRHEVNVVNISIRHARRDPGTLMAWARHEVFAFVLYYKQGTDKVAREAVGPWTRELIDAAIAYGGAYYLPYQILATPQQFHAAYPDAGKLFALKLRVDPANKFSNSLWDAYYRPEAADATPAAPRPLSLAQLQARESYRRDEAQTFLTLPEWVLVYSPAEYAQSLRRQMPSRFPYFGSIGQFWGYYWDAWQATRNKYDFNWGYHVMVAVIGTSYTVENAVKGVYENTIGRVTEWLASNEPTAEDAAAVGFAQRYVDFIRVRPWYEFSFFAELKRLWREAPIHGDHQIRKWERRLILSAEMLVKAQYATLLTIGTRLTYGTADRGIEAVVQGATREGLATLTGTGIIAPLEDGSLAVRLPRYEAFGDAVGELAAQGVRFVEISGNDEILLTAVVPAGWRYDLPQGKVAFSRAILTDPQKKRVGILTPVPALHEVLRALRAQGLAAEHVYDY
ncbi:MAG: FAD-binding oxidoreductase [Steroidobacteraceae bacterium]